MLVSRADYTESLERARFLFVVKKLQKVDGKTRVGQRRDRDSKHNNKRTRIA